MDDDRQIEAKLQRNFYLLACVSAEPSGPIFTKILHDIVALNLALDRFKCDSACVSCL